MLLGRFGDGLDFLARRHVMGLDESPVQHDGYILVTDGHGWFQKTRYLRSKDWIFDAKTTLHKRLGANSRPFSSFLVLMKWSWAW